MTGSDDPLLELLLPHIPKSSLPPSDITSSYLSRLSSLSLSAIQNTEPASLSTTIHSVNLSLQSLAFRNHKTIIASTHQLSSLSSSVDALSNSLQDLKSTLPDLDKTITKFTATYARDSERLQERSQRQLLHSNLERLLDILHLPSLLQSLITGANYPTALDTLAHVRRLKTFYPDSPTVGGVHKECENLQKNLTSNLITTLRGPLKLPVAMKTVGFLRRALGGHLQQQGADERALRGMFLVCRLAYLNSLLEALAPLRDLADEERSIRELENGDSSLSITVCGLKRGAMSGMQTERYLKRWLEVFREHSFGILSMYRSIFPGVLTQYSNGTSTPTAVSTPPLGSATRPTHSRSSSTLSTLTEDDPDGGGPPDPVASFTAHLFNMLTKNLRIYLPAVDEKSARESLLTQVLYASGSLGRLGGEFACALAGVDGVFGLPVGIGVGGVKESIGREEEYVSIVGKQKVLAGRLEAMAAGRLV
jgi:hypothetical protein